MKHARNIGLSSCRQGHLHLTLLDERGAAIGHATLDQRDWERLVKGGDDALVTRGLAPVVITFEIAARPCGVQK